MTYALHFGVFPEEFFSTPKVNGYGDSRNEHPFILKTFEHGGYSAFVSGSWKCWGPADQDTDGDNSLHVLVVLGTGDDPTNHALVNDIYTSLLGEIGLDSRLLDYAMVTTAEDWSEVTHISTFGGVLDAAFTYEVNE
jgi:hypothetical protein